MENQNRALMQGKSRGKGGFKIIFVSVLVLVAIGTGFFYFSNNQKAVNKVPVSSGSRGGRSGVTALKQSTPVVFPAKVEERSAPVYDEKKEAIKHFSSLKLDSGEVKLYFRTPVKGEFKFIGYISRQEVGNSTLLVAEEELKKPVGDGVKRIVSGWGTKKAIWPPGSNSLYIVSASSLYFIDG